MYGQGGGSDDREGTCCVLIRKYRGEQSGARSGTRPPQVVLAAQNHKTQKQKASSFELAFRAGEGIRTLDVNLGKVALYH